MAAAVISTAPATSQPLYDIEAHLAALVETAELVQADQELAFIADLRHAITTAIDKRDRVGQFLVHCESQAKLAEQEIKRLRERKAVYERAAENMEAYVVRIIEDLGQDDKKRYRKLEGRTVTFAIAKCPPSVEITDEEQIPAEYKRLQLTLPAAVWEALLDNMDLEERAHILAQVTRSECEVMKTPLKEALAKGDAVAGARLLTGKHSLRVS
jgi:hypothetical protein